MNAPIESPCVGVCAMNAELGRCLGCHRTRDEIALWLRFTPEQRRAVMAELDDRRSTFESSLKSSRSTNREDDHEL